MLEALIEVMYSDEKVKEASRSITNALLHLPKKDVEKIASGREKLSRILCGPGGDSDKEWLEQFADSPLMEEALNLHRQELQMEMNDLQRRTEQDQRYQQDQELWRVRDQVRLQKKMLELKLYEMGLEQASAPPMPMEAPPVVAGPPAEEVVAGPEVKVSYDKRAWLGAALGGVYGSRKGKEHGEEVEGAIRGAVGAGVGSRLGLIPAQIMTRGHDVTKGGKVMSAGKALATLGVALAGGVGGGRAGYKALTSKYDSPPPKKTASLSRVKEAFAVPAGAATLGKALMGAAKANPLATAGMIGGAGLGAYKGYQEGGLTGAVVGGAGGGVAGGALGAGAHMAGDTAKMMMMNRGKGREALGLGDAVGRAWNAGVARTAKGIKSEGVSVAPSQMKSWMVGGKKPAAPGAAPAPIPASGVTPAQAEQAMTVAP